MDILFLSPADWSGPKGRFQHLAERMARHNRVLYVDGLGMRRVGLRDWRRCLRKLEQFTTPARSLESAPLPDNLLRCAPLALPGCHREPLGALNRACLRRYLRHQLDRHGMHRPLVWIAYPQPELIALLDALDPLRVIYDCVDSWAQFAHADRDIGACEERLIRRADLVFATTPSLRDRAASLNPESHLLPNGVDLAALAGAGRQPEPADLAGIPHPRLGFVGNVADWLDMDLLVDLARRCPDWHLVLVGPWQIGRPVPALPNFHWLGFRSYARIPALLSAFDVGLIPFRRCELVAHVDPLKLYEYLAAGKPVVSTPLPRLADFPGLVLEAEGAEAFAAAVQAALEAGDAAAAERRRAMAPHDWQRRIALAAALLRERLAIDLTPGRA